MKKNSIEQKSLAVNAMFNIIYKIINVIFPLITSAYVSRVLMPEGIGEVAYAQNIVSYFVLLASMGIPTYGIREIARCKEDVLTRSKIFLELFILNFISTIFCIITYLLLVVNVEVLQENFQLYLIVGLFLFFNLFNVDWFYQGIESYSYITLRSIFVKIIMIIAIFFFVKTKEDTLVYAFILALANGGNNLLNIINCRKYIKLKFRCLEFKRHFKPIAFLLICVISSEFYSKTDITMLGIYFSNEIVGYYSNAQKMINIVVTFVTAITSVFLPRLSFYYKRDKNKFSELVNRGFDIICFISIPSAVGIFMIAPEVIYILFGESFFPSVATVRILSFLIIIKGIGNLLCYQVITSSGNEKKFIKPYIVAALINIGLNILLIPEWKQNGAAIASVISELFLNVTLLCTAVKIIDLKLNFKQLLSVAISSLCMCILVCIVSLSIDNVFIKLLVELLIGITSYFGVAWLTKNTVCSIFIEKISAKKR